MSLMLNNIYRKQTKKKTSKKKKTVCFSQFSLRIKKKKFVYFFFFQQTNKLKLHNKIYDEYRHDRHQPSPPSPSTYPSSYYKTTTINIYKKKKLSVTVSSADQNQFNYQFIANMFARMMDLKGKKENLYIFFL